MANRPSHATQQKILAFLAAKPGRSAHKTGPEHLTRWIGKRLTIPEATIISELENLERQGDVKLARVKTSSSGTVITTATVLGHVEPEDWAVTETSSGPDVPEDIDYRKLADGLLLAAFEALSGEQDGSLKEECQRLEARCSKLEADNSLARAERDEAIRKRREAEQELKELTGKVHELQAKTAEHESEMDRMADKVDRLTRQLRDMSLSTDVLKDLPPADRVRAGAALAALITESKR